jgi:predicted amidohydrolase YtcJ
VLIRDAEVDGRRVDVRIESDRIAEIAEAGSGVARGGVLEAAGCALLPGLHDHHIHLMALAAALRSVACGPPHVRDRAGLARALAGAEVDARGWIRGVGHHDSIGGPLDRDALDAWVPDRPLRVQHRSGAMWVFNSAGLRALGLDAAREMPDGVERDETGRPTGRILREDGFIARRIGEAAPDLTCVGERLAARGVTGATDATPRNDASALRVLTEAVAAGALPQRLHVMGTAALPASTHPRVTRDAVKIWLVDAALPTFESLCAEIAAAHAADRRVAIHCVTRAELVLATGALAAAGAQHGDRIEHAAIVPPDLVEALRALPLTIVTQPHFLRERGDAYASEVAPSDQAWLYRCQGLLDAGLRLAGGTDAPFGDCDPWQAMQAAVERVSRGGVAFAPDEALAPERALALFTTPLDDPGGAPRSLAVGAPADLCLLDRSWPRARRRLGDTQVRATLAGGRVVWQADRA